MGEDDGQRRGDGGAQPTRQPHTSKRARGGRLRIENCASRSETTSRRAMNGRRRRPDDLDDVDRRHLGRPPMPSVPSWFDDVLGGLRPEPGTTRTATVRGRRRLHGFGRRSRQGTVLRDVVLIAPPRSLAASGRNGGFMESSLTHGVATGRSASGRDRAPRAAGLENLDDIEKRHPTDAHRRTSRQRVIAVARDPSARYPTTARDAAQPPSRGRMPGGRRRRMRAEVTRRYIGGLWRIGAPRSSTPHGWRGVETAAEQLACGSTRTPRRSTSAGWLGVLVKTPRARPGGEWRSARRLQPLLRRLRHT